MRSSAAQSHIAALAPLIKAGLVTREAGNAVVACWDAAGWKPGYVKKGKWYPGQVAEPAKAVLPIQGKVKMPKGVKRVEPEKDDTPDMFAAPVRVDAVKKWVPEVNEIF